MDIVIVYSCATNNAYIFYAYLIQLLSIHYLN